MKKLSLSFGLIIVFAFYALLSSTRNPSNQQLTTPQQTPITDNVIPLATKIVVAPTKTPTPVPTPTPVVTANIGKFKNGTYSGPAVDAYYGTVQVSATIQGGKLADVQFLQYPNDRSTSIRVNTHAMPILKSEAIQAQSASVDGVSGATATSGAFQQSLGAALATALN